MRAYGQTFGDWLRDAGATVYDLAVPFHTAVTAQLVREVFAAHPEIGGVAREHGAPFYLDAVASVGAEPVLPDAWGVDLCVIGAQKAMGGPAGVSAISVSERAWAHMAANPNAPRRSYPPPSTGRSAGSTAAARRCCTRPPSWRC